MKIIDTRPGRFEHRAAYYSSPEELLAVALPLARKALREETPVALIASPATEGRLREALGSAGGLIRLPPPEPSLRGSGQAVATQRARELRELTDWNGSVNVIAEHHPDLPGVHPSARVEAEAAMNIALASLPITMTCLYPTGSKTKTVTTAVQWNHAQLVDRDGNVRGNPDVRKPSDVLATCPVSAPPRLDAPDRELTFTAWRLVELREAVREAAEAAELRPDQAEDFVLAVNEVASNAVEHGYTVGQLHLWRRPDRVLCEVHDHGRLREPLPGLCPPHRGSPRGRGLWIARQLCDLLHVWSDEEGTHVRLQATRA